MRIITGQAKGTKLYTLPGDETRPTSERVKEAIFSAIQFDLHDRVVLDLFAGSGQLALEALSRGAGRAVLVDASRQAAGIMRDNAVKTKMIDRCRIVASDWKEYLKTAAGKEKFGLVFLDPPYKARFLDEIIKRLLAADVLAEDCIIICESERDGIPEPVELDGWSQKLYPYGNSSVTIIRSKPEGNFEG